MTEQTSQTPNNGGQQQGNGGAPANGGSSAPWYGELPADSPKEFREWLGNKGFKDPVAALESYYNAEKLLGAPADSIIRLPKPDDAEGMRKVWQRLGAPEKPDGYELPVRTGPDGKPLEADVEFTQFTSQLFHKVGLPKNMAQAIVKEVNEYATNRAKQEAETLKAESERQLNELRQEWGGDYDKNAEFARRGLKAYGEKAGLNADDLNALELAIGTSKMLKLFHALGQTTAEHDFGGGGVAGVGLTPGHAKAKMDELRQQRIEGKISQKDYLQQVEALAPIAAKATGT